jgi:hypothetical protein
MNKLLLGVLVVLGLSGCASTGSTANNNDPGGHCVAQSVKVGDAIKEGNTPLKVQWISGPSYQCQESRLPVKAKLVLQDEFLPVPVYQDLISRGNYGNVIFAALLGAGQVSSNEQQSIIVRECLTAGNYRAWSCVPSLNVNTNSVYVNGYYRNDGTYVQGHYRTAPNSTRTDNYSYRGNVNPYTRKVGTQQ